MDFYFISVMINTIWQIFTIIFILYKFTSFFSTIYNYLLFISKLFYRIQYIFQYIEIYIKKKRGYNYQDNNSQYKPVYNTRTSFISNQFEDNIYNFDDIELNYQNLNRNEPLNFKNENADLNLNETADYKNENVDFKLNKTHKPFNVITSNTLLDSEFVLNMFKQKIGINEENEYNDIEEQENNDILENNDISEEFKAALLQNDN
jgi:hypothetical protein